MRFLKWLWSVLGWTLDNLHWLIMLVLAMGFAFGRFADIVSIKRDGLVLLLLVIAYIDIIRIRKKLQSFQDTYQAHALLQAKRDKRSEEK